MALPEPKPGLVIRYDYLWSGQATGGQEHGKDRPAGLVAASDVTAAPRFVVILPITQARLAGDTIGIEIPLRVRQALGLDDAPSWVIVSEFNVDEWPNAGLAPIAGRPGVFSYGFMPPGLFAQIKAKFLALSDQSRGVKR